jgi:hypothetical protein
MTLTSRQWRQVLFCTAEELRARRAGKAPGVQPWNAELVRAVELELAVSESGHDSVGDQQHWEADRWITARQAADILGLSKRQTQRLAADLEGHRVDGRWQFRQSTVMNYTEGRQDGRAAS